MTALSYRLRRLTRMIRIGVMHMPTEAIWVALGSKLQGSVTAVGYQYLVRSEPRRLRRRGSWLVYGPFLLINREC